MNSCIPPSFESGDNSRRSLNGVTEQSSLPSAQAQYSGGFPQAASPLSAVRLTGYQTFISVRRSVSLFPHWRPARSIPDPPLWPATAPPPSAPHPTDHGRPQLVRELFCRPRPALTIPPGDITFVCGSLGKVRSTSAARHPRLQRPSVNIPRNAAPGHQYPNNNLLAHIPSPELITDWTPFERSSRFTASASWESWRCGHGTAEPFTSVTSEARLLSDG